MPTYTDNAKNRRLNRVGKKVKKKIIISDYVDKTSKPAPKKKSKPKKVSKPLPSVPKKTTITQSLQQMPLDIGSLISEAQTDDIYKTITWTGQIAMRSDYYRDEIVLRGLLGKDKVAEIVTRPNNKLELPKNIVISYGEYYKKRKIIPSSVLMYDGGKTISQSESGEDFPLYYDVYEINDENADKYGLDF
jgi:hypothetical protein